MSEKNRLIDEIVEATGKNRSTYEKLETDNLTLIADSLKNQRTRNTEMITIKNNISEEIGLTPDDLGSKTLSQLQEIQKRINQRVSTRVKPSLSIIIGSYVCL